VGIQKRGKMPNVSHASKTKRRIALASIGCVLMGLALLWSAFEFAFFADINGLNLRLGTQHAVLVENRGTPNDKEVIAHENGSVSYILHYDGIRFFVSNETVIQVIITGEQYTLGGRSRIGVGATRRQVEADLARRQRANNLTADCACSHFRSGVTPEGEIWFSQHLNSVAIAFDQSDVVMQMHIYWVV